MAINFPNSPSDGDLYSAVGRTWQYNSTASAWESISESNVTLTGLGLSNHDTLDINSSGQIGDHLIPDTNITRDLGTVNNRWRDLYLSGSSIQLGTRQITQENIPDVNLSIAPEVLEIQVDAPDAGQDTMWKWTWEQSTLPYARRTITNSGELNVPLYKEGTYVVNNFAAYDIHGSMTQTHSLYLKWIDGAGTDNLVSWATSAGPISDTHPDINGGNATDVQRITVNVPATVTPPSLTNPAVSYTVVNSGSGSYTFSGSATGNNPNLGPFYRGGTYTININATGHPFYFTTDNGTNFAAGTYFGEYTSGVTGSRTDSGTITFTVPAGAPNTLYYQCGNHSAMRGEITVKDLAVETNINGNYVVYFQHTQEGHKTPVELRPIPSLVNQMCLVYDSTTNKFVPQDLATYVENTPSFENKIREVAGTAELVVEDGSAVIAKVNVYDDSTYLPLTGNNPGDQAFATDTDILYIWDGSAWQQAGAANSDDLTEGSTNLFFTDARADARAQLKVDALVDAAPGTLDTLNELAAALGDDENFSTTVTNSIATKLATSDFTSTANTWIGTKDTGALTEGSNLYYTQARDTAQFNTDLATKSTTDLTEGTNLYYTNARADARIALQVGSNLDLSSKDTDDLSEGSNNLYFLYDRVRAATINAGSLRGSVNNATVQYATSYSGTPAQGSFFFDSLNQKLKVYTGSAFVDAVPAGGGGGGGGGETDANATLVKYTYTITSSTNSVSGSDDNSETLTYATGGTQNVEAYVNGVKQVEGASNDYVATTGTSVTFVDNLSSGDVVDIQVYELLTNDAFYLKTETYTQAEVNSQISTGLAGLVDSAPSTLDTLNELAAALGDDANFSTTVTNSIATKLPLAGGTMTGKLKITNPSSDYEHLEVEAPRPTIFFHETDGTADQNFQLRVEDGVFRIQQQNDAQSSAQDKFVIKQNGNVGIGTTNPQAILHSYLNSSSANIGLILQQNNSSQGIWMDIKPGNNTDDWQLGANNDGFAIYNTTDARYDLVAKNNGNIGIGIASPSQKLHVNGVTLLGSTTYVNGQPGGNLGALNVNQTSNTDAGGIAIWDNTGARTMRLWVDSTDSYIYSAGGGDAELHINGANGITTVAGTLHANGSLRLPVSATDPGSPSEGKIYYNSTSKSVKVYDGSDWIAVGGNLKRVSTFDIFSDGSTTALYNFDGNPNDAGGSYNMTGSTSSGNFAAGKFGQAFNGSGGNYLHYTSSGIQPSGAHTVSFWYNSSNTGQGNKRLVTVKGASTAAGWNNYNGSLGFYIGNGTSATASVARVAQIPDNAVNDGQWHHLAYTVTTGGTGATWKIYLDGSEYSGAVSGESRSFNSGSFVAVTTYDGGTGYNTIGKVDQLRILNRVITSTEVEQLYNAV